MPSERIREATQFSIGRVQRENYDRAVRFYEEHYWENVPLNRAFNLFSGGTTNPEFRDRIRLQLEEGPDLTFEAIDETGNLAGMIHGYEWTAETVRRSTELMQSLAEKDRKFQAYVTLESAATRGQSFLELFQTERLIDFDLCVLPQYSGMGVGRKLCQALIDRARNRKCNMGAICYAEAAYHILKKEGFEVRHEIRYADVTFDGRPIILPGDPNALIRTVFKCINGGSE